MIAAATGTEVEAEEIIADMKDRHEAIKEKAEESVTDKKKVWVEVSPAPDIFTTGQNTFMHEMLESIQAINAAEDHDGWVKLTEEEIVQLNPDVIITTYGYYVENPSNDVLSRDGWAEVPAVKDEQVFDVDNDTVTRPGPRLIEGVETLAELIYPEIFKQ
jgi:iron complex transport system substrate-binding protein